MLRALQDKGISVESSIEPYLPKTWARGEGVEKLRFRDLFTHRSTLAGTGSSYTSLRTRIGQPFPALPAGYAYGNANFGLMRILLPRVMATPPILSALDSSDWLPHNVAGPVYSTAFEEYVRTTIFKPIGIDGRCKPSDPIETLQYMWPPDLEHGYKEGKLQSGCGGYGWFLSSNELGAFMAHRRHTDTLLNPATRATMDQLFLGWLEPTQFPWSTGPFGTYHNHGGDWEPDTGEAHSCTMKFPIKVEVSVVMNSERGWFAPPAWTPHQCQLLADAFHAAWIP